MVKVLLVIECSPHVNWYDVFRDARLHGSEEIRVEQATWGEVSSVVSYPDAATGCQVELKRAAQPHAGTSQERQRTVRPDMLLMRSVTRSVGHLDDRNKLYALKHANVPSVNTLHSCFLATERVWMFSELKRIQQRLGADDFPLIPQICYANASNMLIDPGFPCVVKIGPYHSGFGKIKVDSAQTFQDVKGIVAMHSDYSTAERFVDWDYDIRIQKIGPNVRAFRRRSPNWKGNTGNASINEDAPVTAQYRRWVDACACAFGGLDILALDAVHDKVTGKDMILELNDTAIGLAHRHEREDYEHMRTLVLTRMAEHYPLATAAAAAGAADAKSAKSAAAAAVAVGVDVKSTAAPAPAPAAAAAGAAADAGAAVDGSAWADLGSESGRLRYEVQAQLQRVSELRAANEQLQKRLADAEAQAKTKSCCVLM